MKLNYLYTKIMLFSILISTQIVIVDSVITIPSKEGPLPISSRDLSQTTVDHIKYEPDVEGSSDIGRKKTTGGYYDPPKTESERRNLEIKKSYYPISSDGYMANKAHEIPYVSVEIKCLDKINDPIYILEKTSKNLEISNYTNCSLMGGISLTTDNFFELASLNDELIYERDFCMKEPVNVKRLSNNSIYIKLNELDPKERAVYQYEIKPKGPGTHETYTIIRSKNMPDLDHSLSIDFRNPNPKFDVKLNINNLEESFNKQINITYDIIYLGGDSDVCEYNVRLDEPIDYIITNNDSLPKNILFDLMSSKNVTITIQYPYNDGSIIKQFMPYHAVYTLPGIWIGDRHYPFDERVTVDTFSYRYIQILAFFSGLLGLILVQIGFLSTFKRWTSTYIRRLRSFYSWSCNKCGIIRKTNSKILHTWIRIKFYMKRKLS